jgi:hypothetical protein
MESGDQDITYDVYCLNFNNDKRRKAMTKVFNKFGKSLNITWGEPKRQPNFNNYSRPKQKTRMVNMLWTFRYDKPICKKFNKRTSYIL